MGIVPPAVYLWLGLLEQNILKCWAISDHCTLRTTQTLWTKFELVCELYKKGTRLLHLFYCIDTGRTNVSAVWQRCLIAVQHCSNTGGWLTVNTLSCFSYTNTYESFHIRTCVDMQNRAGKKKKASHINTQTHPREILHMHIDARVRGKIPLDVKSIHARGKHTNTLRHTQWSVVLVDVFLPCLSCSKLSVWFLPLRGGTVQKA